MFRARNSRNRKNCRLLFEGKEGLTFLVFDTETTGLKAEDYIVELAAKKYEVHNQQAVLVDEIDYFMRPPFFMDEKVMEIHGITNEYLADKPTEEQMFANIQAFFGEKPIVVGYNVDFDIGMLSALYTRCGGTFTPQIALDVLEMAYDLVYGNDVPNYKLGTMTEMFGLDAGLSFHNALDDVEATARLLNYFYGEYKKHVPVKTPRSLYVNSFYFWKGMNKEQSGIWVDTNLGKLYFSTFLKAWRSSSIDLEQVNIDELEYNILSKAGLTLKEFGRLTEKKFRDLKDKRRAEGVYL